jgi:hypothetical protein
MGGEGRGWGGGGGGMFYKSGHAIRLGNAKAYLFKGKNVFPHNIEHERLGGRERDHVASEAIRKSSWLRYASTHASF